ncbi:centromere-associated protein E isoform X8 [Macaca thibetana thibetana]|uniref:centromere-associated protein E isoform X8 n=1 Tax=Macaca thibetana thibetana TaxID=257877 RepID=UPI0021BCC08F|nr:centromere-associated protein E isoform X8 [Macaca thibetana thibetana]
MAEEGAVAVCVRVRPLNSREESLGETAQVYWKTDNNAIYQVDGSKSFNFDRVFHGNETTKNVYEEIAAPIIDSAIQGYNGTIFAYGQTASGKTYTMMGSEDHLGVTPRAIHDIFQKIKKFPDREFLLRVSYMEIYNETITDLLCGTQKMKPLIIREDVNRNVYVADLTEEVVYTSEMALKWITKGEKNRHYGETKMNQRSSRSHTIFRMILESREKGEPSNCEGSVKVSHLNLVDLAGSERAAQTGAEGVRLKEGCNINRSLFILGQVIKKLSDGQVGGFINYRDSKLTRILQNSLGGNAKTRIICTITPVSFDETLTTLQFASTAKYMKNTPYVNEVSTDEALLKRYRKEIMDLKKQLEEVSLETRAQAMEKDQLAQLLEEKDLLQKVQNEKIENLTRMLVTSSSLTSQQELKAKRKRRVTWCLGKINKMKNSNYVDQFNMPTNITTKTHKLSINVLGEIDESVCSESDVFSNTLDTLNEIEWNPATKLLNQENIESELNSLRADYDNLVLDYEQLRTEKEEMELKLKEKNDLDEFEALERKTKKDQENELSSKVELLREKEDQIKKLQEYIDSQKLENIKMDLSYSLESIEDQKQMKQTLFDAETVALDAKRESAFLRSENLELKEKMQELASTYKQMENDIQLYQSQLEAKKKMQVDLEKELQSAFNEITKLTSLIDGKVPKDLLYNLELEGKITDLQKELNKEVEENEALRKEVNLLSELKSLPSEVERLRKEIHDKSEELHIITSEKHKLFSEVVHKESRVQGLLEEIGKTKDDLATTQSNYKSTDQEFQNFKSLHIDFEQKYKMVLEENARMNQEIVNLSKEAQKFDSSLDALKTELSYKTQELQKKTCEVQERLNEMEELKEQLENRDSTLQTVEREKTLITEKLQQTLEEVKTLTQEKDDLKQLQKSLQIERDQLKSDIHDTVNMNIDTQEQLRNALESLKQHQETINTLKLKISEEVSRNLHMEENTGETKDEFQQKMVDIDKKQDLEAKNTQTLTADVKDDEIIEQQRKIFSLIQEKNELQQVLESVIAEKEQLKTDLKENIEMTIENQEELRILGDELKKQQEIVAQEKNHTIKKEEELSRTCDRLAEVEEKLKEKSQQLQEKQQQLLNVQEEMSEMQKKINEMENLKNELKNKELTLEHRETERLGLAQKLNENYEEMKSITKERKVLKELQESFETERDQLRGYIREIEATGLQTKEELKIAHIHLKEHQETIDELRRSVSEKTAQIINIQDLEKSYTKLQEEIPVLNEERELLPNVKEVSETQETVNELELLKEQSTIKDSTTLASIEMERLKLNEKFQESQEEIRSLTKERDNLKMIKEALEVKHDQLKEHIRETLAKIQESQSKQEQSLNMKEKDNETTKILSEMEQFKPKDSALLRIEIEMLRLSKRLQESHDEMKSVAKEKDDLQRLQEVLQSESDQLKENIKEIAAKHLETEEELKVVHCCLKEQKETIDELRVNISEKETEISTIQKELEAINDKLQNKIQEIYKKEEQLNIKRISETQEKVNELKQFKEYLKAKDSTLQSIESKMLELTSRLQESQEEIQIMIKEKEEMKRVQEALQIERDQLQENTKEIIAKMQESQEKEYQFLKMTAVNETQEKMCEIEHLKEQFETQKLNLENTETENIRLTQILHENLEEMRSVTKERDDLRNVEETLKVERDQLKENLRETITRDLEKQEELKIVHMYLKEHQETIDELRGIVSEKTNEISNMQKDLENSNAALKAQDLKKQEELRIAHMHLKEHQETIDKLRGTVSEKTDKISNMQKDLENSNAKLQEKIQELKANEHQLFKLKKDVNETQKKVSEMEQLKKQIKDQSLTLSKIETENLNLAQKLHENLEEMKSVMKERDNLRRVEETLKLERDQLMESLQETKARDLEIQQELKTAHMLSKEHKETIDKLREKILEKTTQISNIQKDLDKSKDELQKKQDQQNHQVKPEKRLLSDGQQHLTESLREKCSRIKELLKRYSEMDDHYECLNRLSLDLEKEIEIQKELSMRVKANLSLPYLQTKQIEKLFTANQRCSMEFHRIMKKLKYVLSYVTKIKEEQHESINKFEMDFIDEVEKQKELLIKIQHLQQDCDVPSRELRDLKLNQNMDLHIEEILKDFSESEFPTIKTEFQQILSNRKEMTQFLEEWLNTRFDIEKLKNGIQKENDRICQMNNFFNNRIIAIMNESTEFEERSATISKEWEQDLKSLKEKNEKLFKNYQTLKTSLASGAQVNPTTQDNKNPHVTSRATQLTTEKIRELENSLHEAKESAMHKESEIIKMQKELEVTNDMIAKLQAKVNESNKCLETTKETIQVLQDKVALGAKPYKEEIEDLKTKLVKIDLEKMKNAKEFEKEISATKATVEYQKEVIRLLRENLRRSQQAQDTSMISEHTDSQPSNKPLTCGGGSGIVQNTKALILKSEHIRLEKEISKLKQQNEQLIKQKNDLLSNNQHLSNEVKTWKERTLKREAYKQVTCENSPKSPKVTGTASKKKQITPSQCKERNLHDPTPKESPKSWFFDSRSKSLPSPHPVRYFDNSNLGLCPEVQNAGAESVDSQPGPWHASSGKDVPECKTQ